MGNNNNNNAVDFSSILDSLSVRKSNNNNNISDGNGNFALSRDFAIAADIQEEPNNNNNNNQLSSDMAIATINSLVPASSSSSLSRQQQQDGLAIGYDPLGVEGPDNGIEGPMNALDLPVLKAIASNTIIQEISDSTLSGTGSGSTIGGPAIIGSSEQLDEIGFESATSSQLIPSQPGGHLRFSQVTSDISDLASIMPFDSVEGKVLYHISIMAQSNPYIKKALLHLNALAAKLRNLEKQRQQNIINIVHEQLKLSNKNIGLLASAGSSSSSSSSSSNTELVLRVIEKSEVNENLFCTDAQNVWTTIGSAVAKSTTIPSSSSSYNEFQTKTRPQFSLLIPSVFLSESETESNDDNSLSTVVQVELEIISAKVISNRTASTIV